jgi:hypothetical protein
MSTIPQLLANRRNSQLSTGPRSATGKATSSQNALKTGIYSEAEIIRGENRDDLDALAAGYYSRFQPDSPEESCLVDILVHSEWMLRRLRRAEAELWELNLIPTEDNFEEDQLASGRAVDCDQSVVFARLQRRVDSTQRNYLRALKELKQLQSEIRVDPCSSVAITPDAVPAVGFVPSTAVRPPDQPRLSVVGIPRTAQAPGLPLPPTAPPPVGIGTPAPSPHRSIVALT